MQILRKMDVVAICFFTLLAISLVFIFMFTDGRDGIFAEVFADGALVLTIDIEQSEGEKFEVLSSNGINKVLVEGGAVRMIYANCPDQYCVRMGAISNVFRTITCLPNRVVIEIVNRP